MKKILTAVFAATIATASINAAVADEALQTQTQQKLMIHSADGTAAGTGTMTQTKTQTKTMKKSGDGSSSQLKKQFKKGKK
ncbi:hypothetical protein [Marinobacterium sp. LSUCC0821]|uniref:hypothetical protein n=1 Tax=Marinobacterium sp. LSUCC0821 TaxID=2668067 RepID=UPI001451512B|nr:hypothetical protein [Marinobacterium sp. LSUCC0821]QJD71137.1 hypothetical protein HH196_05240 [Marinobacterium sp. LSUCC0821]